jgi:hypothetical protein
MIKVCNSLSGAVVICSLASIFSTAALAITPTPAQRSDCMNDVISLCMHAVPNNDRVFACLSANKPRLSSACRAHFNDKNESSAKKGAAP